jgi:hypothetical protein
LEGAFEEDDQPVAQDLPDDVKQAFRETDKLMSSVDRSIKDRKAKG